MTRHLLLLIALFGCNAASAMEPDKLFEKLSPSVWVVSVYDAEAIKISSGSAVAIGNSDLITNCHVLTKGKSISVKRENTLHGARLLHADVDRDLCIISAKGLTAPAVEIAPLSSVRVGQRAYAIGAPRGYELTLSDGLVSSLLRDQEDRVTAIQMSVPISPGSSGGGLFDQEGRLIGIPSRIRVDAQNLNFAIPAEWIQDVPQRAKAALEKLRSQQAAEAAAGATGSGRASVPAGRQLKGGELRSHFAALGTVTASTQAGNPIQLNIQPDGTLEVRNVNRAGYTTGAYEIKEADSQVCFVIHHPGWKVMQNCYRLFETAANTYAMRSVANKYFFTYSKS